mmetsp:Transcript_43826/g.65022  ORF Transcript_43826/g.65022 Transcript_43826/m.65022 type:complete len:287 (-) Transcript_43826:74-934(-)
MYFLDDVYLGKYSNIPGIKAATTEEEDFGLDAYEPRFMQPLHIWKAEGEFSVKLRFDTADYTKDLFYFCQIHEFMGGRIKITRDGAPHSWIDNPSLGYEYDQPSEFDTECGTYGLANFQLPNSNCPDRFVCDKEDAPEGYRKFAQCIDAIDCHMISGMTTGSSAMSEDALFVHQMIPHHQNAVNMAKALLKTEKLECDDIRDQSNPECVLTELLYEIINNQNHQIQTMYDYLDAKRFPYEDDCVVEVETVPRQLPSEAAGNGFPMTLAMSSVSISLLVVTLAVWMG